MDIEKDSNIPLILDLPFMLTAKCVADMGNGNLEMSVEEGLPKMELVERLEWFGP